ncbi:unnamed protein product [Caenorhabditis nigoni]
MGPKFMDYIEFEFWWMRFSAGNFDLDYDRSQDPKYRTITDMPVHIFEKICENLGEDDYQIEYRFIFRNVCKSFRALADSWIPNFENVSIESYPTAVFLNFDRACLRYTDENEALNDLMSIIAHPEHEFDNFDIYDVIDILDEFTLKLESLKLRIHVENVYLGYGNWEIQKRLLPFYQAETVKMVYGNGSEHQNLKLIDEICKLDREERVGKDQKNENLKSVMFSRMEISFHYLFIKQVTKIIKKILRFSNLKYFHLKTEIRSFSQLKSDIRKYGAKIQADDPMIFHYPIPNSSDFLEIQLGNDGIRIERKSA